MLRAALLYTGRMVGFFLLSFIAGMFRFDEKLAAAPPPSASGETGVERQSLSQAASSRNAQNASSPSNARDRRSIGAFPTAAEKALRYRKAPEFVRPDGYINTGGKPITLSQFRGKNVVLIDFWDYSCINCLRTLPHLTAWYRKYKSQGLEIIGVHTPEFAFEQVQPNVAAAVRRFDLAYPVVLDNRYRTWNAFQNEYWPREYLVDIDGYIVHDHAGEGDYDGTEQAIRQALAERAARLGTGAVAASTVNMPAPDLSAIQSPETYFGSNRNEYLGNGRPGTRGVQTFVLPGAPEPNTLYLGGSWNITPEYAEAHAGDRVLFKYGARDVYMVAANPGTPVRIKVLRDGKPAGSAAGADVDPKTSEATIDGDRLYKLIHDPAPGIHTIELEVEQGTLDVYTFTFG